jgi:hypothetical protein
MTWVCTNALVVIGRLPRPVFKRFWDDVGLHKRAGGDARILDHVHEGLKSLHTCKMLLCAVFECAQNMCVCLCVCTCVYVCACVYVSACMHISEGAQHVHVFICVCVYVCVILCVCMQGVKA